MCFTKERTGGWKLLWALRRGVTHLRRAIFIMASARARASYRPVHRWGKAKQLSLNTWHTHTHTHTFLYLCVSTDSGWKLPGYPSISYLSLWDAVSCGYYCDGNKFTHKKMANGIKGMGWWHFLSKKVKGQRYGWHFSCKDSTMTQEQKTEKISYVSDIK